MGKIHEYTLGNKLGTGPFGAVYEAYGVNEMRYALKVVPLLDRIKSEMHT